MRSRSDGLELEGRTMKIRWWLKSQKYIWREGRWAFQIGRLLIWFGEPDWKQRTK